MTKRCIMLFPKFTNGEKIEEIREKYDPLAQKVGPHITLVFPFISDLTTDDLRAHIEKAASGIRPFHLKLYGVSGQASGFGNYLFLNVVEGSEELNRLHNQLYTGVLEEFYSDYLRDHGYHPHLTVGRIKDNCEFDLGLKSFSDYDEIFECEITEISVEIIDNNENSIIEMNLPLAGTF